MNCRHIPKNTAYEDIMELLIQHGTSEMSQIYEQLFNEAMLIERERHIKARSHQRTPNRRGDSNGFKNKKIKSKAGRLNLKIPQVRDSSFYPKSLERGSRSERAVLSALAEMYVQGTSTRKVTRVVEELCGFKVTSSDVSRANLRLDESLSQWRSRPLGEVVYLYLDARYEKIRHGGSVRDCAVLIASGVLTTGHRTLLGVSVSLSEAEVHWRAFLQSLLKRGLHGVKLIISDAHSGLKAARTAVLGSVPWQRCQFHLQQNAQSYAPKQSMKSSVAETIRNIFNADSKERAVELLMSAVSSYAQSAPKLSEWMESNITEGLTVFDFPSNHRRRIRTTNSLERINREIKRRTRVATLFPNEASCERLISAVLIEISEEWETGKTYMSLNV